jgi:alginate export protein
LRTRASHVNRSTFKYIPLSDTDRYTYLSFGADTRERFEANNAAGFGTGSNRNQDYVISRNEFHADLRIANQVQAFVQFQADYAPWKTMLLPVDTDRLDLEPAFIALVEPLGGGTLKLRAGSNLPSISSASYPSATVRTFANPTMQAGRIMRTGPGGSSPFTACRCRFGTTRYSTITAVSPSRRSEACGWSASYSTP